MEHRQRASVVGGLVLIAIGVWALFAHLVPGLEAWVYGEAGWPLLIVGAGLLLLVMGLLVGAPEMAIPACIVAGVGGLLYWQNITGHWESWAYAWALIPGFVGVGIILAGLFRGQWRSLEAGGWLLLVSLVLFTVFGSLLGGVSLLGPYWPVLLIVLGLVGLVRRLLQWR